MVVERKTMTPFVSCPQKILTEETNDVKVIFSSLSVSLSTTTVCHGKTVP